jgi:hypothetical protein
MSLDIFADFFSFVNPGLFSEAALLLIISFLVWELPRSIKLISEEYTKGAYPEGGRVLDFIFLAIGLASAAFALVNSNAARMVAFIKTPGMASLYLILMVTVPLIVLLGFFKRFFGRMDKHESVTVFIVHCFLDLAHTAFFVSLAVLVIPAVGFLIKLH